MRKIFKTIADFINEYTSGFVFVLWFVAGLAVAAFIFIFRNEPYIQFDKLKYVIIFSAFWFVFSDIAKKRKFFPKLFNFILDSIVHVPIFGLIIYFTNGFEGGLYFVLFLATISAPLFAGLVEMVIFLVFLSVATFSIFYFTDERAINAYHTGIILLQIIFFFIIAGLNKFLLEKITATEIEEKLLAEKIVKECKEEVRVKTGILEENIKKMKEADAILEESNKKITELNAGLQEKLAESERFKDLAVGREIKMMELKREIEKLKESRK